MRARSSIPRSGPCDREQMVEINTGGVCGCGWRRSFSSMVKSLKLWRVWATGVPRSPGLASFGEKNPTNILVGFQPRDQDQRWENGGGESSGRVGVTPAKNLGRGEGRSGAIRLRLALARVGECHGPTQGHETGLNWPVTAQGATNRRG
jgi:hypothetical protein